MGAVVTAAVITAGVAAGSAGLRARSERKASDKATKHQTGAIDRQIGIDTENEARRRQEWQATQDENKRMWESEVQREQMRFDRDYTRQVGLDNEDKRRYENLNPYRQAGRAALGDLQKRMQGSMADITPLGGV